MFLKKSLAMSLLSFQLLLSIGANALAAPPEKELNQYLTQISWTKQDLLDYLNYYEMPLDAFDTVDDLKEALGTPINAENLQDLLAKYQLSKSELNSLLSQFGDSVNDYKFIEDLDDSLAFYTNNNGSMGQLMNELAKIGVTKQEIKKFFDYLTQVEENNKNQLDQMQALDVRMEQFLETADPTNLTDRQLNELADILQNLFQAYEIQVKLKLNNKAVTVKDLLTVKKPGNFYAAIFSKSGELLLDFSIPAELFQKATAGWEELIHIGELANEFVDYLHEEKYNGMELYK